MSKIPNVTLNNGKLMPILGLGTMAHKEPNRVYQAVRDAIEAGYRHFDTAHIYDIEEEVGRALNDAIKDGQVKREELFVVTKLWLEFFKAEKVIPALKESLRKLNLDYLDLYLLHWPMPIHGKDEQGNPILDNEMDLNTETWPEMEKAIELGLTKSIGISNFNIRQVDDLMKVAKVKPVVNQVESHPFLAQRKLKEHCEKYNIYLTAYSPLGGTPTSNPLVNEALRSKLLDNELVKTLATKYNKTVGQILIKFNVQRQVICIPKSFTKSRIVENADIFDFQLDSKDVDALEALNCNERYALMVAYRAHKGHPFVNDEN